MLMKCVVKADRLAGSGLENYGINQSSATGQELEDETVDGHRHLIYTRTLGHGLVLRWILSVLSPQATSSHHSRECKIQSIIQTIKSIVSSCREKHYGPYHFYLHFYNEIRLGWLQLQFFMCMSCILSTETRMSTMHVLLTAILRNNHGLLKSSPYCLLRKKNPHIDYM